MLLHLILSASGLKKQRSKHASVLSIQVDDLETPPSRHRGSWVRNEELFITLAIGQACTCAQSRHASAWSRDLARQAPR
jgi:hypothetical protein